MASEQNLSDAPSKTSECAWSDDLNAGPWTRFMDMHSGGGAKEDFEYLFIQAPEPEARTVFFNRFGHNPSRVTCTCCGDDYSIEESATLAEATRYDRTKSDNSNGYRDVKHTEVLTVAELFEQKVAVEKFGAASVAFIVSTDIEPGERIGRIPAQGYVWMGDE